MAIHCSQTLENDLQRGVCPSKDLVCLVVDECHRATGDHSMAKVVQLMRKNNEKFRVLALSATPGNNHGAIQVKPLGHCKLQEWVSAFTK